MTNEIKVFAHRGASGHAFENSFKAFDKAIYYKTDGIEIDIQCSKDGKLFVIHDVNLTRLVGVNRFIYDCLAEELIDFKIGNRLIRRFGKMKIPTIEEFMDWWEDHKVPLNIELKESLFKHPEEVIAWIIDLELPEGSHFSSFFPELLQLVKQVRPELETALIITKLFDWEELNQLDYIDAIHASKKYYKRLYLDLIHASDKKIRFYGIDGSESFLKNPHPSVVGWITDYPGKVKRAMNR